MKLHHTLTLVLLCIILIITSATAFNIEETNRMNAEKERANSIQYSDYGLDVDSTGYRIWDADRLVGEIPLNQCVILDSIINEDNQ